MSKNDEKKEIPPVRPVRDLERLKKFARRKATRVIKKHPIGQGSEAKVNDLGIYVLRTPLNETPDISNAELFIAPDVFLGRNVGQMMGGFTDPDTGKTVATVHKRINGFTMGTGFSENDTPEVREDKIQSYLSRLKKVAEESSIETYMHLIDDLNFIAARGFYVDSGSQDNIFFDPETKRFRLNDLLKTNGERPIVPINTIDDIVTLILIDQTTPDGFQQISNRAEYKLYSTKVITNLLKAAKEIGLEYDYQLPEQNLLDAFPFLPPKTKKTLEEDIRSLHVIEHYPQSSIVKTKEETIALALRDIGTKPKR